MPEKGDIVKILKAAIEKEIEAYQAYREAAQRANDPEARSLLEQLALDEVGHREVLEAQLALMAEAEGIPLPAGKPLKKPHGREEAAFDMVLETCKLELEGVKRAAKVLAETKQEIENLQRSKDDFYSMVTHDLRSPLISLVTFSKKLLTSLQGKIPEKDYQKLQWIWSEAKGLEELVNNFLDLARLTSDRYVLSRQTLDPHAVARGVIETLDPQAKERGQRFEVKMHGVPWLEADEWAIKRLMMNLLGNAVRHGRTGGIIEVGGEGEDEMVRLWVRDDGPGISEKDLPHIFDKFYTNTRGHRGSGLGLAIAREIVETHGGRIWVETKEGEGCTFYFTLPRVKGEREVNPP